MSKKKKQKVEDMTVDAVRAISDITKKPLTAKALAKMGFIGALKGKKKGSPDMAGLLHCQQKLRGMLHEFVEAINDYLENT